jgi:uncharacterized membrane protein YidH (DUF202 family)
MLGQRLLSSHLLILSFRVVFLVDVHGFSNAEAVLILLPSGIGYFFGTWIGGEVADRVQRRNPRSGRILLLQVMKATFLWHGTRPDPRFSLANERTFLAWIRTSLALLAGGVALEALKVPIQHGFRFAAAALFVLLGLLAAVRALGRLDADGTRAA